MLFLLAKYICLTDTEHSPSALNKSQNSGSAVKGNGTSTASEDEVLTTQHGSALSDENASDTTTIFEAFKEVSLDLTLSFSTQNSPVVSTVELPSSVNASPLQAPSLCVPSSSASVEAAPSIRQLGRTMSFASQFTPFSPIMKAKKKYSSTKFSSDQSSILRGSWPAIKYVGRGTPVDRNRRREWGGLSAESVGEDGLLFSDVRATSLDSRSPRLSSSSDWDFLNPRLPTAASPRSGGHSIPVEEEGEEQDEEERIPPLQKIEIKIESEVDDWASVMETVLSSAEKSGGATKSEIEGPQEQGEKAEQSKPDILQQEVELPLDNIDKLQSEMQFDLNIDKALDLGFSPAVDGGTLFTLAAITDSDNSNITTRRTATISSHSRYSTPSEGLSDDKLIIHPAPHSAKHRKEERDPSARALPATRSTGSAKVDLSVSMSCSPEIDTVLPWWRKALGRLKRVQALLRSHRNSC